MDILKRDGALTANEVVERLEEPSNSGVRTLLRILETKRPREAGGRRDALPVHARSQSREGEAIRHHVLSIFFNGSPGRVQRLRAGASVAECPHPSNVGEKRSR